MLADVMATNVQWGKRGGEMKVKERASFLPSFLPLSLLSYAGILQTEREVEGKRRRRGTFDLPSIGEREVSYPARLLLSMTITKESVLHEGQTMNPSLFLGVYCISNVPESTVLYKTNL